MAIRLAAAWAAAAAGAAGRPGRAARAQSAGRAVPGRRQSGKSGARGPFPVSVTVGHGHRADSDHDEAYIRVGLVTRTAGRGERRLSQRGRCNLNASGRASGLTCRRGGRRTGTCTGDARAAATWLSSESWPLASQPSTSTVGRCTRVRFPPKNPNFSLDLLFLSNTWTLNWDE